MEQVWYYLDPDNRKEPKGLHCARCKRPIKETQSFESFRSIILHPENPWFRLAGPFEKATDLIGSVCLQKMIDQYGVMKQHLTT